MSVYPRVRAAIRFTLLSSAAAAATLAASVAFAQDPDPNEPAAGEQNMQEVVVTGSRIITPNLDSPSPVQTITSEQLEGTGTINVQEILLKNPTMGTPLFSRTNSAFLTSGAGVATVDLRNLGVERTLTLIDGRRFVSGVPGSAAVDYNTIPTQFIDRIDVLTGGASAVYGSDAVAGVVNIILKKNFEGIALDGQYGASAESDSEETQVGLTFGTTTADDRGNIMAHVGYTKQGAVFSRDRTRSAIDQASTGAAVTGDPEDLFDITRPFYSGFAPQGRFFTGNGDENGITYDAAGNVIPWDQNGELTAATGFNRSAFRTIAVPVERYLFAGRGSFDFTENHGLFFEGTYASTNASSNIEPFGLAAEDIYPATGGQIPVEFEVDGTLVRNPVVPDEVFNTATDSDEDGLRDFYFAKRLSDFGPRTSDARRDTFRIVGGLQGSFSDENWRYEAFYAYGQTKEAQTSSGQVNVLNFRNALEAIADVEDVDNDGNVTEAICRDANARIQGCVPVNVFGYDSFTPEAVNYIEAPGSLATFTSQRLIGANLTGSLFEMPAGPLAVAVGIEYREETSDSEFDALTQAGLNAGNAIPPTRGEFDVGEAYLEASVPLLSDVPFADQLTLRAAVRASDYSTVGSTLSWNGGSRVVTHSVVAVPRDPRAVDPRAKHRRVVPATEPDVPHRRSGSLRRRHGNVGRSDLGRVPRRPRRCREHRRERRVRAHAGGLSGHLGLRPRQSRPRRGGGQFVDGWRGDQAGRHRGARRLRFQCRLLSNRHFKCHHAARPQLHPEPMLRRGRHVAVPVRDAAPESHRS